MRQGCLGEPQHKQVHCSLLRMRAVHEFEVADKNVVCWCGYLFPENVFFFYQAPSQHDGDEVFEPDMEGEPCDEPHKEIDAGGKLDFECKLDSELDMRHLYGQESDTKGRSAVICCGVFLPCTLSEGSLVQQPRFGQMW